MTDLELIQALRHCACDNEYGCIGCPGEATCDECSGKSLMDAADRLEVAIDNQKKDFDAGAMAMQEAVLDILNRMSVRNKGIARSALRDAMAAVNNLEVEHE